MTNRNASPTVFGYEFQMNVGLYFMFKYLSEILSIRIEGEKEDVEVKLKSNKKFMIQVKANYINPYDNRNANANLKKSITTLSESDSGDVQYLFYASNADDPLNSTKSDFSADGIVIKKYNELSSDSKKSIDNQISSITLEKPEFRINTDKLVIIRIPFFGEFEDQKYKYINQTIREKLSVMSEKLPDKVNLIRKVWQSKFIQNASSRPNIIIKNDEICSCIIIAEITNFDLSDVYKILGIDETFFDEAYSKYQRLIDEKLNQYSNISYVYSLWIRKNRNNSLNISDFVNQEKLHLYNYFYNKSYVNIFEIPENDMCDLYVSQMLAYVILRRRSVINSIKKEMNL